MKGDILCAGGWGGGGSDRTVLQVHNFAYGLLTPVLGYIMSCMGAFLGLRCTTRARPFRGTVRARWLLLGGVSIGTTGVWLMHFIAMLGFTIPGETIYYNVPVTILSLLVVVGIVCVGLLIVGFGRDRYTSLILGITVISFVLTATIALSPSAEEIRYDAALLDHIRRRTQPQR